MRRSWNPTFLAAIATAALVLTARSSSRAAGPPVVLNFDNLTGTTGYSNGIAVPANARLSNQYLASNGILFASGSGYVAVGNYGAMAPSGANMIAGTSAAGAFDYAAQVTFSFWDPANPSAKATTDFFSVRGDLDPTGGGAGVLVTVSAFDVNGALIGSTTQPDIGGEIWSLALPGMHSIRFPGTSANPSFGGIALDDVTFNPVTVPEPTSAIALLAGTAIATRRRRFR